MIVDSLIIHLDFYSHKKDTNSEMISVFFLIVFLAIGIQSLFS